MFAYKVRTRLIYLRTKSEVNRTKYLSAYNVFKFVQSTKYKVESRKYKVESTK